MSTTGRSIVWPMTVLTSLFFMWGFMTVMNDVLVPHLKQVFALDYSVGLLVQSFFFGAYFTGSLVYYWLSRRSGDPIQRIGYKRGLIAGLLLSATGSLLFVPATFMHVYAAYLFALFVLGLGFTLLQIAANPFVAIIGPPEGASSRLNMAQAFNSLGTTLAPLIGGALIFDLLKGDAALRYPYLAFGLLLIGQAVWVHFTQLPEPVHERTDARSDAWRHPQLRRGMVAIFCYVGAEVAIGSLAINYLGLADVLGLSEGDAKHYLSLYWGGAMTGRFLGAMALSRNLGAVKRYWAMLVVGGLMFALLYSLNTSDRFGIQHIWPLAVLIVGNMTAFVVAGPNASRALGLFAIIASVLLGATITTHGAWAMWAVIAIGLFNSIMWSNIFTLAIDGLGDDTSQGSSLLVMMIVGGALVPLAQGAIIDMMKTVGRLEDGFHWSFLVPLACYAYLAWYGFKGSKHEPLTA
jgi:FHS family L-fucose permease-like MFS transporter